jgi:hypothetical protein
MSGIRVPRPSSRALPVPLPLGIALTLLTTVFFLLSIELLAEIKITATVVLSICHLERALAARA